MKHLDNTSSKCYSNMHAELLKEELTQEEGRKDWALKKLLYLQAELFWFQGHFPTQAILPGIAQVNWVLELSEPHRSKELQFAELNRVKFQKPLLPTECILLELEWRENQQSLDFKYSMVGQGKLTKWPESEGVLASSGRVKFKVDEG